MPVAADDPLTSVAGTYQAWARLEAHGRSAAYESLAEAVARDATIAGFVASLPPEKRQPNLLFASLPALAQLPEPLALIEVGASAGLTLLFDRYSYDYGGHRIAGSDPRAPTVHCQPHGPVPLPRRRRTACHRSYSGFGARA